MQAEQVVEETEVTTAQPVRLVDRALNLRLHHCEARAQRNWGRLMALLFIAPQSP